MVMTFLYQLIWIFNKDIITSKLAIINMLDFEYWRSFYSSQYMYLVGFFFLKFKLNGDLNINQYAVYLSK